MHAAAQVPAQPRCPSPRKHVIGDVPGRRRAGLPAKRRPVRQRRGCAGAHPVWLLSNAPPTGLPAPPFAASCQLGHEGRRAASTLRHPSRRRLLDHPGGLRVLGGRPLAGVRRRGRRRARRLALGVQSECNVVPPIVDELREPAQCRWRRASKPHVEIARCGASRGQYKTSVPRSRRGTMIRDRPPRNHCNALGSIHSTSQ